MDNRTVVSSDRFSKSSSYTSSYIPRALEKITSKRNIAQNILPPFIQVKEADMQKKRVLVQVSNNRGLSPEERTPSPIHRYTGSYDSFQNFHFLGNQTAMRLDFYDGQLDEYRDYIESLKKEENKQKPVIKLANLALTVEDLLSFVENSEITRKGIDACLTLFKKENSEMLNNDEAKNKIIIASTSFAWRIFNAENFEDLHAPTYIFLYDYILFPIYIGYWTLLVIDRKELIVTFYDCGCGGKFLESILINCFKFLLQEFHYHKNSGPDLNSIKSLRYEHGPSNLDISEKDSAVFILMIVKKYAILSIKDESNEYSSFIANSIVDLKGSLMKMILDYNKKVSS